MKNKITSSSVAGIYIFISINNIISENKFENNYFGLQLEDTQETNTFKQNNISNNTVGIFLGRSCNNIIFENNITNNIEYGFYIVESSNNNFIYHNNIIFNNISGFDICVNIWNDSYPFGGNYGSDYSGIDIYHGPNQNIPGSDGIGDTPYELPCEYATDYYPFMEPDGWINHPPNKPEKPNGTKKGKVGIKYIYLTSTIDLDNQPVYFKWDWGDGNFSDWLGPFKSGENASATHEWDKKGIYQIRVKAKDIYNEESEWSDQLEVIMPKSITFRSLFLELLERFPNMFPILRYLNKKLD